MPTRSELNTAFIFRKNVRIRVLKGIKLNRHYEYIYIRGCVCTYLLETLEKYVYDDRGTFGMFRIRER